MNITVDKNAIGRLYSDKLFVGEMKAFLNSVIDEEIEKADEMDTELIDECIDLLSKLDEDDNCAVIIPFAGYDKILKLCHRNKFNNMSRAMRASLIACIILLSALTANTVIAKVFDYNVAQEVIHSIGEKLYDLGIISSSVSDETESDESVTENTTSACNSLLNETENEDSNKHSLSQNNNNNNDSLVNQKDKSAPQKAIQQADQDTAVIEAESDKTPEASDSSSEVPIPFKRNDVYKLYLDPNGGKCSQNSVNVEYGKEIGKLPVPEKRSGYKFLGWYCEELTEYNPIVYFNVWIKENWVYKHKGDLTATAIWDKLYTITFDANGGTCSKSSMEVRSGVLLSNLPVPEREGYLFDGWYYNDKLISANDTIPEKKNVTFIAHWSPDIRDYILTFNANGGTCNIKSKAIKYGEPYGELPVPVRNGYTFIGWNEDDMQAGNDIKADDICNKRANKTVYAIWGKNNERYKVYFDANGGECDVEYQYYFGGIKYGTLPKPVRYGYKFECWRDKDNYPVYSSYYMSWSEKTLYASWRVADVVIKFDLNDGSGKTIDKTVLFNTELGALSEPKRIGYAFDGWYTEPDGGRKVAPSDAIDFAEETRYYAHWIKMDDCKIIIHKNDGSGTVYTGIVPYGDTFNIDDVEIPQSDKVFLGWFADKTAGERVKGKSTIYSDINIYAHWKTEGYCLITIHFNDAKRNVELSEIKYGEKLGELKIPNNPNSDFIGWYDDIYYGEEIKENTIITEDIDLYAHWSVSDMHVRVKNFYKQSYQLNEKVSPDDFKLKVSTNFASFEIDEEGMKRVRCTADTSDYGTRTVYFTYVHDCAGGVYTYTGEGKIFVEGCPHNQTTHIEKYREPSCSNRVGYTGDTVCDRCGVVIKTGEPIDSLIHTENYHTKLTNNVAPSCNKNGYTGDLICTDCGRTVKKGENIPALGHDDNTKTITYDIEPTCISPGYKGVVACAECGEVLYSGEYIEELGHNENTPVQIIKKVDVTCTSDGYTGDEMCLDCGQIIKYGEILPATGHVMEDELYKATFDSEGKIRHTCQKCGWIASIEYFDKPKLNISTRKLFYDGTVQIPEITLTNVPEDCYTIEIEKGSDIGYYKITATLFGDLYEGTKTDYYRIMPPDTDIKSISARSKGITLIPSNICEKVDGYQIEYRIDQIKPDITTVNFTNNGSVQFTKTGLLPSTRYQVRIRAYKDVIEDGKKVRYYSDWSSYKKVTTLK